GQPEEKASGSKNSLVASYSELLSAYERLSSFIIASGYREPEKASLGATSSIRSRSSLVRATSSAPQFSCKYLRRFVPGIGTICSPCARTQASASCADVHFFSR